MVEWRRHIHATPEVEMKMELPRTEEFVVRNSIRWASEKIRQGVGGHGASLRSVLWTGAGGKLCLPDFQY
jgi:metal-dependent amidase/aminoacylase/carboxypeptidase family protein